MTRASLLESIKAMPNVGTASLAADVSPNDVVVITLDKSIPFPAMNELKLAVERVIHEIGCKVIVCDPSSEVHVKRGGA